MARFINEIAGATAAKGLTQAAFKPYVDPRSSPPASGSHSSGGGQIYDSRLLSIAARADRNEMRLNPDSNQAGLFYTDAVRGAYGKKVLTMGKIILVGFSCISDFNGRCETLYIPLSASSRLLAAMPGTRVALRCANEDPFKLYLHGHSSIKCTPDG